MPDRLDLDALRPAATPAYMTPAWLGCISWALGEKEIIAAYREDTGDQFTVGRTPIERLVDKATGCDLAFLESFIRWANVQNVWGPLAREDRSMPQLPVTACGRPRS